MSAIAQDRGSFAQVEDLVQPVAHEEDADLPLSGLSHDGEQALDLMRREGRRGLVEDEDACLDGERLRDLDELLVRHRESANRRRHIEADAKLVEESTRLASHLAPGDRTEPTCRRVADTDVLRDRQVGEEAGLLVDDRDSHRSGVCWAVEGDDLAVEHHGPGVRLMDPGQDLDQGALAGAVLAHKPMDLSSHQLDGNVIERLRPAEVLGDPDELSPDRRRRRQLVGGHSLRTLDHRRTG